MLMWLGVHFLDIYQFTPKCFQNSPRIYDNRLCVSSTIQKQVFRMSKRGVHVFSPISTASRQIPNNYVDCGFWGSPWSSYNTINISVCVLEWDRVDNERSRHCSINIFQFSNSERERQTDRQTERETDRDRQRERERRNRIDIALSVVHWWGLSGHLHLLVFCAVWNRECLLHTLRQPFIMSGFRYHGIVTVYGTPLSFMFNVGIEDTFND